VHRDVSPSNLLVSFEGEVKVCDFGIARANDMIASGDARHELDEAIKGKAGYMSPEHARGEDIDARADVFAAGIILWELAAGRRLYRVGEGRDALLEQARRGEAPELPSQGLPEEGALRAVIQKALARDRASRYASAGAMLRDLEAYAAKARLMTSPLQLGEWLEKTFGEDILARRRARERAAAALEKGAPVVVQAIPAPVVPARAAKVITPVSPVEAFRIDVEPPPSTGALPSRPSPVPPPALPALIIQREPVRRARTLLAVVVVAVVLVLAIVGGALRWWVLRGR
jgi:serine/threonine-protein kinase